MDSALEKSLGARRSPRPFVGRSGQRGPSTAVTPPCVNVLNCITRKQTNWEVRDGNCDCGIENA